MARSQGIVTDRFAGPTPIRVRSGGPDDSHEQDRGPGYVEGICPCRREKCFCFDAVHEPHVVILCDCSDW